jgi:predicted TIM-barrel fold metal-dependent hydrolase
MIKVNRRKFVSHTAASAAGLMLGSGLAGFTSRGKPEIPNAENKHKDLMKEVMKYRKIDSHAHVYIGAENAPDRVLYYADHLGIDKLMISRPITSLPEATPENFRKVNDQVIQCMKQHPDRFIGTMVFNASYQKESLEEIDRCVDAGMVGAGELYRQVKINDPLYYPIIEKFIDLKMVVMQHSVVGYSRVVWHSAEPKTSSVPEDFVDIAKRYPEAMFQYAHIGGGIDWEYACKTLKDSPNVYVDISGSNNVANMIDFAMQYIGEDRLLFGCDNCFYQGVGHMFSAKLTDAQRRKIFFENYNGILKKSGNNVN